jgi:DDE family transposase
VSFCTSARALPQRFQLVLTSFLQKSGLAFAHVLPEENIQAAFDDEGVAFAQEEDDVYTPPVTLWAFLSQVLFKDEQRSCVAAVSRVVVLLVALGKELSDNTGAYCRARAKLPETVIRRLALQVADDCERALPDAWLWHGRQVHLVDGTTVSMPDTEANQEAYPQHTAQPQGLGFPIARMVVLLSLATAMVSGMALGPYAGKETGETALLRELFARLHPGDVLLADRYYGSYFLIAMLRALGVDFVVRLHHLRHADFRRGRRLGHGDHLVWWKRPAKPDWMDRATYDRIPEAIQVRELEVHVDQPGFRTESFVVVTTLVDATQFTRDDLAELYQRRWLAELDIRAIKVTLGMDVLRCKSPEMVRKEIWTCLLAYNLIRRSMLQAADSSGRSPRALSFTAAMQKIAAGWVTVVLLDEVTVTLVIDAHLDDMVGHKVGHRPNRVEPRAIKRRPKPHKLLMQPRAQARAELLTGKAE